MIYLGYFLLFFAALRLVISLVNLITFPYIPRRIANPITESISILIPARNEEKNIDNILSDLIRFRYEKLEILIYDDESNDATPKLIQKYAEHNSAIRKLTTTSLPDGWLGKNHACHRLAQEATGDYLLFIDADVRIQDGLLERILYYLKQKKLHLLSIFPMQILKTRGEKISVPLMNWILLSFLPLLLIRLSRKKSLSAANGQFMFFRTATYRKFLPHEKFKCEPVEDIAIMRYYKQMRLKVATLLGNEYIRCRMYAGYNEAKEGFSKNILHFFGNNILLATLFGIITSFGLIIVSLTNGIEYGLLYFIIILTIRIITSLTSKQDILMNLIYMLPHQYVFIVILINAIVRKKNKSLQWKERNIS